MSSVAVKEQNKTISRDEVLPLAAAWFRALDNHDPIEECYKLLAERDLRMQFPDGDIHDQASFKKWYDRVTNIFFDENHNLVSVEPRGQDGDRVVVDVIVAWQASWWEPPAAKSKRVSMDATQRWIVRPSSKNAYGLEIVFYNAQEKPFNYAPGFARL